MKIIKKIKPYVDLIIIAILLLMIGIIFYGVARYNVNLEAEKKAFNEACYKSGGVVVTYPNNYHKRSCVKEDPVLLYSN